MGKMGETKFHRIRHYQGRWSSFDQIERCEKPMPCFYCQFKHPFCSEEGRVDTLADVGGDK